MFEKRNKKHVLLMDNFHIRDHNGYLRVGGTYKMGYFEKYKHNKLIINLVETITSLFVDHSVMTIICVDFLPQIIIALVVNPVTY